MCYYGHGVQQSREARYSALKIILEDNIRLRDTAEERFQSFFEREVHRLHNDVREESEVRSEARKEGRKGRKGRKERKGGSGERGRGGG